jgi:hypothetical protein
MLAFTDRAIEAIETFHRAAARFDPRACIRLTRVGEELRPVLAEGPEPDDEAARVGPVTVYVEAGVTGRVDAGEHNVLTVGPR